MLQLFSYPYINAILRNNSLFRFTRPKANKAKAQKAQMHELSKDPTILKDSRVSSKNVYLHGVALGDNMSKIPSDLLTDTQPSPDNWLYTDEGDGYLIGENGIIVGFALGYANLIKLRLIEELAIERIFGIVDDVRREGELNVYFFMKRGIKLGWDSESGQLHHIFIGKPAQEIEPITAKELLYKMLEFYVGTPNKAHWHPRALQDNEPQFFRYLQILSLSKAFGLTQEGVLSLVREKYTGVEALFKGSFLLLRSLDEYDDILAHIQKYMRNFVRQDWTEPRWSLQEIQLFYQQLIKYRIHIHQVVTYNKGISEPDISWYQYPLKLIKDLNSRLEDQYAELDFILTKLLDPEEQEFSNKELVMHHNYPHVDVEHVEGQWRV